VQNVCRFLEPPHTSSSEIYLDERTTISFLEIHISENGKGMSPEQVNALSIADRKMAIIIWEVL